MVIVVVSTLFAYIFAQRLPVAPMSLEPDGRRLPARVKVLNDVSTVRKFAESRVLAVE